MRRTSLARRISRRRGVIRRPRARIRAAAESTGFLRRLGAATVSVVSGLTVRSASAFSAAAVLSLRGAATMRAALHALAIRSAAIFAATCRLTVRFALGLTVRAVLALRAVAAFAGRRAAGAGVTVARMQTRSAAVISRTAARFAAALRQSSAWLLRRLAESGPVSQRAWVVGLSAVALVFVMLVVPWVRDTGPSPEDRPVAVTVPDGEDLESEIAALGIPPSGPVREPAPFAQAAKPGPDADGSVLSYLPNEDLTTPSAVLVPPQDPASTRLALLPERPRARPPRGRPQWLANAIDLDLRGAGPLIAIVIDDVGIDQKRTARAIDLPAPLTLAFIPYGYNLERHTRRASDRGHELLVHMPMEPGSATTDPGPNALLTGLGEDEIMRRFLWGLAQFDGYVGVNNHMGSRFMARGELLEPLLAAADERGLLFLDSRTKADTKGSDIATRLRLPNARRDIFLDNELTVKNVTAQLAEVERVARKQGHAVAIGHPHDVTVDMLAKWIPQARARGFTLVPVSTIVRLDYGTEYEDRLAAAIPAGGETESLLGRAQ